MFIEESQGIYVPPIDLILPLLRLRHVIHIVVGASDFQSLTVKELSLVEEITSGKLGIPSTKEAKALVEGTTSSS